MFDSSFLRRGRRAALLLAALLGCDQAGPKGGAAASSPAHEPTVGIDPEQTAVGASDASSRRAGNGAVQADTGSAQRGPGAARVDAGSAARAVPAVALDERQTLIPDPSWSCGMPQGIAGPQTGQFAFDIDFDIADVHDIGHTPFGHRRQIDVRGGAVDGPRLEGRVLPRGLEYELTLENGVVEIEQIHVLRLGEELVFMRTCGVSPGEGVAARVVLDFEAEKNGKLAFLNTGRFVATRSYDASLRLLRLKVYELQGAPDGTNALHVTKPPDVPSQSWECTKSAGAQGRELYKATIDVATSWLTVGESKYGTRNIIPIYGGSLHGMLSGRVLSGGADYQIIVDGFSLDARYTLQTDDGELIIVRNCGELGALIPTFETRSDGPYAWLNGTAFRSADPLPSLDLSQINLTIYDTR